MTPSALGILAAAASRRNPADLTESEKVALAVVAGVPFEFTIDEAGKMTLRVLHPVTFYSGYDGRIIVAYGARP